MVCPYMVIWGSSRWFHVSFATRIWSFRFGALSAPNQIFAALRWFPSSGGSQYYRPASERGFFDIILT